MMENFPAIGLDELTGLQASDVLVLTVNNRHARRVLAELSARLSAERRVMAVPDIVPLSGWLARLADELAFLPDSGQALRTVDGFGAQLLWQQAIAEAEPDQPLLDIAQAARLAADADRLADDWRIRVRPEQATSDYQRFLLWREQYHDHLAAMDLEDGNQAYERICESVCDGTLALPFETLVLAGFNELSPRMGEMLAALTEQGVQVLALEQAAQPAGEVLRLEADDPDAEWRLAAQWAARQLQANPQGSYAIVASRLEADVALAHRSLRAALGDDTPYNIAVARPLAAWPLMHAALAWLGVMAGLSRGGSWAPADLGAALLAGGCAGGRAEAPGRAAMDAYWRRRRIMAVSASDFSDLLGRMAPQLSQAWQDCGQAVGEDHGSATADVWSRRFRRWLEALGFPGQEVLDSHAFQVMEALDRLLDVMARLSFVAGTLSFGGAVGLLRRLARETPFQPQRDPASRLDVLGFLESEGGRWDGVWVLGLTDEVLPAPPRPNPFIPLMAQRDAGAPRATPERELRWAQTLYASLLACAPQVVLSHPRFEGERLLRPSPCIAAVPAVDVDVVLGGRGGDASAEREGDAAKEETPPAADILEYLIDDQGPPLEADQETRGGIGVIDTQARNPLWAFAKYRLGASALPPYAELFDQNARGELLHRAIEIVWRMVPDQAALRALEQAGTLEELVGEAVQQAADEFLKDYGDTLRGLEVRRAEIVLRDWLQAELQRAPFAVKDVEQKYDWRHGALALSLRLDRIDTLEDGRLAVIDYKSGGGSIDPKSDWMRARPVSLQLPFYAAVLAEHSNQVGALVLARLHAREIQMRGLADGEYGLEGVASLDDWPAFEGRQWEEVMGQWRRTIEALAQEYAEGLARNEYLRKDDIRYCDALPFLRLNEEYPE